MKLAEALIQRRDLQNKLAELKEAMVTSTLIEEDDTLDISVEDLLAEYERVSQQLSDLIIQINQRNQTITVGEKAEPLQAVLEQREALRRKHRLYTELIASARENRRYGRNEIRLIRTVNLKDLTDALDTTAKRIREVDGLIQQTNWLADL